MVEAAAHLTYHVFARLAVRHWVLSMPKRLCYYMQLDGATLNMVLRIFLRVLSLTLPGRIVWELRLVVQGGLRILDKIEVQGCTPWRERPSLGARDLPPTLWGAWRMRPANS